MKKLFISCPMRGRTDEAIRATMEQMHRIAEAVFDEELEVIQSYIEDTPPDTNNVSLWCLGKSIQMMADADYFIGIRDEVKAYNGCIVENHAASRYGIPSFFISIDLVAPDIYEAREQAKRFYNGRL